MSKDKPREFNKVDRALEMQVIDWLQWHEFPDEKPGEKHISCLALELISKRKRAYDKLQKENQELKKLIQNIFIEAEEIHECYDHTKECYDNQNEFETDNCTCFFNPIDNIYNLIKDYIAMDLKNQGNKGSAQ